MPQIILTPKAQDNLKQLYQFIANERPSSAREAVDTIITNIDRLALFPEIGVPHRELTQLRVLVIPFGKSGYSVYYKFNKPADRVEILNIRHDRQLENLGSVDNK